MSPVQTAELCRGCKVEETRSDIGQAVCKPAAGVLAIRHIFTRNGWLYLADILDLHSRRVIGCAVSNRMTRNLAILALKIAVALPSSPRGFILRSDRGNQYSSHDDQKTLRDHGLKRAMRGKRPNTR